MRAVSRRSVIALASAAALCLFAMGGGASALASKGVKGDPQPELKPFTIGASAGEGGTVAVASNGDLIVAYVSTNETGIHVCVLARAGHKCKYTHVFSPLSSDGIGGIPQVFAPSPNHVDLLMGEGFVHGDQLFSSTDGGKTFGAGVLVGDEIEPTSATLVDGQIVITDTDDSSGVQVGAISVAAPAPPATLANPSKTSGTAYVGSYKNGVLVAGDNGGGSATRVEYAASGSNFNATSSYKSVGVFSGERLGGMSGNALLTVQTTGKEHLLLRFFNGTSFGASHVVPGGVDSGPQWWTMDKDPGGVTHIFRSGINTSPVYELVGYSTTTGSHWSTDRLGAAIGDFFSAGLDKNGSGVVLGVDPAQGYPILAPQHVSFSLSKSSVKKGHKVTGKGKGSAAAKGRKVELQIEKSGKWFDVASTHEKSSGSFTFKIKGSSVGKHKYRAVASDHAGYVEFGYSAARTLTVKK
jgi:hypothetical protein